MMQVPSIPVRMMRLLVVFALTTGSANGFRINGEVHSTFSRQTTSTSTSSRIRIESQSRSSTRLGISLGESWEQASSALNSGMGKSQLSTLQKDFDKVHWERVGSKGWFDAVGAAGNELVHFYASQPLWIEAGVVVVPLLAAGVATLYSISNPPEEFRSGMEPYVRGNYDPMQARVYYAKHPFLVLQRFLQVLRLSNQVVFDFLVDKYIFKDEEQQRSKRSEEVLVLITNLGPTAIKVGQALSVRPDLIPEEYANALATLQDQVPPFEGSRAKLLLREQLGEKRFSRLREIGLENKGPIAAASIGQVYRGFIDDKEVAVKVQRPNVLAEIALDLHIVREFAPIYQKFTGGATDLQSLANEWGRGFIAELDYQKEAAATIRFNQEMKKRNLNAVTAPTVVSDFSTEQILVTEWVEGTRLDQSDADDVPRLCAVALNAYLVMLLELQSLHCDPHPGNLLRRTDGTLCILDFGMTLDVNPTLQYSLLEFVAHLTSEDYDKLPEDLVGLGFLKPEKLDFARRSGALEPLKFFLKQAGQGGGADVVRERIIGQFREKYPGMSDDEMRVEIRAEMKQQASDIAERESVATGVTVEIEELQRQNKDSFAIPEWFLYTSRAFLTLEGVSLQSDSNYSLIQSCFPYVAKRLVVDQDPRARKALRDLLYGASDAVDVERIRDLADGFSSYTTTTKTINNKASTHEGEIVLVGGDSEKTRARDRKNSMIEAESSITLAKDSADILLAPEGNLLQNLLIEESALAISAGFKDQVRFTFVDGPKLFRDSLPFGVGSFLPPLPFEEQVEPFIRKTKEEIKAQVLAEKLLTLVPRQGSSPKDNLPPIASTASINGESTSALVQTLRSLEPEQAALVIKELRENLPKYSPLITQLGGKFLSTLLRTASSNIETTLTELESVGRHPNGVTRTTVRSLSSIAQRGASALSPVKKQ